MTDLRYGRGGSPLQNLIVFGHNQMRLSALKFTAGLDAGPVYDRVPLGLDGSAEDILLRAAGLMAPMIVNIIEQPPVSVEQTGEVGEFVMQASSINTVFAIISMR